eukprot:jgi/Tetstr1/428835/TSEL_018822.t1
MDRVASSSGMSSGSLMDDGDVCWICLDGGSNNDPLSPMPCACPRHAHTKCIARWQLQSAGTRRETHCEFCSQELPDWRGCFPTPEKVTEPAIMNVTFNGLTYGFPVKPGKDGYAAFTRAIQAKFSLPSDAKLNITFTCDEPVHDCNQITLRGEASYDAAVHCATLSAARRQALASRQAPPEGIVPKFAKISNFSRKIRTALAELKCTAPQL